ncbi:hypothetical protein [Branchiibius cervicis]|uniref:Uncharacterized protein n=1 Tax=Branchiibius cervicis TaxID=908252 RepID=A0ABW2ANH0_9MICO
MNAATTAQDFIAAAIEQLQRGDAAAALDTLTGARAEVGLVAGRDAGQTVDETLAQLEAAGVPWAVEMAAAVRD